MKGVKYVVDENDILKAVVIDIKTLERYDKKLEDLLDGIIAESRKNDGKVPLEKVIGKLKKAEQKRGQSKNVGLQEKLNRANKLLSRVSNPEILNQQRKLP